MKLTKKCHGCGEIFRKTELIDYASPGTKTMYSYCSKCLEEKHSREKFSNKVCQIFGLKSPGPILWTQRKRLQELYGYTDTTIIDCLDYLYNIKQMKKLSETLYLVKPNYVEEMLNYKKSKAGQIIRAVNMETKEYIAPVQENKNCIKTTELNPDDWLDLD